MNLAKRIHELLTKDLSYDEFQRLLSQDAKKTVAFYLKDSPDKTGSIKSWKYYGWYFPRMILISFLTKMRPERRVLFAIGSFLFLIGLLQSDTLFLWLGFLIPSFLLFMELADKHILKTELDVASEIQKSLLPQAPPELNDFTVTFRSISASTVGGDFVQFEKTKENQTAVIVGDVSGKGIGAALYMVRAISLYKYLSEQSDSLKSCLSGFNQAIRKQFPRQIFLTTSVAVISESRKLELARAGHLPFIHYKLQTDEISELSPKGLAIGMNPDKTFSVNLETLELEFESGDWLLIYTDGVTECRNENQLEFGIDRLKSILMKSRKFNPEQLLNAAVQELEIFRGETESHDDLTLVLIKCK